MTDKRIRARDTRNRSRRKFMRRSDSRVLLLFSVSIVVIYSFARGWFTFSFNGLFL